MGSALFEVGEVLGSRGNIKAKKLRLGGTLFCRITPVPTQLSSGEQLRLSLRAANLKPTSRGIIGSSKPCPFLEMEVQVAAASGLSWQALYRSEPIMQQPHPVWPVFMVDLDRLRGKGNNGFENTPIRIQVWDWAKSGKHKSLGRIETTVAALRAAQNPHVVKVADPSQLDLSKAFRLRFRDKEMGQLLIGQVLIVKEDGTPGTEPSLRRKKSHKKSSKHKKKSSKHISASDSGSREERNEGTVSDLPEEAPYGSGLNSMEPLQNNLPKATPIGSNGDSNSQRDAPFVPAAYAPLQHKASSASSASFSNMPNNSLGYDDLPPAMAPPPERPQFIDYISGGCELELCIAIDYTGSNGDPRKPGTLHYIHPDGSLNDYEKALTAVGGAIAKYDTDQKFPVWGFGAKYGGVIQHCFQIGEKEELDGIDGVLEAYRNVFRTGLTMSGPTVFEEVINLAAAKARSRHQVAQSYGSQTYVILLILTDGAVSNVELTRRVIQSANDAPLSIVIVGIGDADFSEMQFLDDFQAGIGGGRDICQFVEFRKYKHDKRALTEKTLEEIPDQLVDFFYPRGIMPMPPGRASRMSISNILVEECDEQDIDLSVAIDDGGKIFLTSDEGTCYDDTEYNWPQTSKQPATAPYRAQSQASYQSPVFSPAASPSDLYSQQQNHYATNSSSYSNGTAGYMPTPPPAPPVAQPPKNHNSIFYVQVPPGVTVGQQLRIRHPETQQEMIVTIPPGVAPGGAFGVQY